KQFLGDSLTLRDYDFQFSELIAMWGEGKRRTVAGMSERGRREGKERKRRGGSEKGEPAEGGK
ncbi:hypothetical protein ACNITR_27520, partial [Escherichia coli]